MTKDELTARLKEPEWSDLECKKSQHIAFRRIGFSENAGWGLNDVIANWTKLGHARPTIKNGKASKDFEVTLMAATSADAQTSKVEAHDEAHDLSATELAILNTCLNAPQGTPELLEALGYRSRTGNLKKALSHLVDDIAALERTLPDAVRSKNQKYRLTAKGKELLEKKL
jgi:ATP-dependent DNA helicase RecG